jgi:hypothetical protein
MKTISEKVVAFFKQASYPFTQIDGESSFKTGFCGDNADFRVLVSVDEEDHLLNVYTLCPINVPKKKLPAIAELIARINCNLSLGNFDIDMDDGMIAFRTGIKVGHKELKIEALYILISGNSLIMDHYFPAIASVVYDGSISPKKVIGSLKDANDECIQDQEKESVEDDLSSHKKFNGRMRFFSDN